MYQKLNNLLSFEVNCPDLATITFVIKDDNVLFRDQIVGQFSLPLKCVRPGYRSVHLKDKYNNLILNSKLIVRCNWKTSEEKGGKAK